MLFSFLVNWFQSKYIKLSLKKALLIGWRERWRQVDGGMQSGVCEPVFAILTHLTALYDGWSLILCVRTGPVRAGSQWSASWSFHLLQQNLFLLSFLFSPPSKVSVEFSSLPLGSACFLTPKAFLSPQFLPFLFPVSTLSTHFIHVTSKAREKLQDGQKLWSNQRNI